jgi:hypothetical protein
VESVAKFEARKKELLTVSIDEDGGLHHEFAPEGQTINTEHYLQILRRLLAAINRKRPEKRSSGD